MQPLRMAIAGTGMIGAVHADAARRAGARVVGVAASTPERAKAAAVRLGAERSFDHADELATAPDVDVVHVCTPNALHGPLVRRALAAGKHVVCEKPLSTDLSDALELADLARESGLVNAVPFVYRYHAMAAEARHRVRSGAIGDVRLLHGHYLQDWLSGRADDNWRVDAAVGGASRAFADIGSHWCDLVEWVSGHRIAELTAVVQTAVPERVVSGQVGTEDVVHMLLRTDRGATGSLVVSQVSPGRKNRLWFEIDGAEHSVVFDQENPETLLLGGRTRTETVVRDPGALSAEAARLSPVPAGHPLGYRDCFAAFVADVYEAVRRHPTEGVPDRPLHPTFADAARTARITEAVLRSAHSRSWIEVC